MLKIRYNMSSDTEYNNWFNKMVEVRVNRWRLPDEVVDSNVGGVMVQREKRNLQRVIDNMKHYGFNEFHLMTVENFNAIEYLIDEIESNASVEENVREWLDRCPI